MSHLSLFRPIALAAAIGLASCGGGGGPSSATTPARSFAPVASACEINGATALLPGSNGRDVAPVPDNTAAVCGCWVRWMQAHLSPADQDSVIIGATLSGTLMSLTDPAALDRLAVALRSCEPRPAPGRRATSIPSLAPPPGP